MTIDLDDLEAKARAASPGPWRWEGERLPDGSAEEGTIYAGELDSVVTGAVHCQAMASSADAAFIAAANPAAVLELVERVRAAEAIVRDLAASDPVIREHAVNDDGTKSGRDHCSLCVSDGGWGSAVHHAPECPWRRAVEAAKP